jgi:hypothetical protein
MDRIGRHSQPSNYEVRSGLAASPRRAVAMYPSGTQMDSRRVPQTTEHPRCRPPQMRFLQGKSGLIWNTSYHQTPTFFTLSRLSRL